LTVQSERSKQITLLYYFCILIDASCLDSRRRAGPDVCEFGGCRLQNSRPAALCEAGEGFPGDVHAYELAINKIPYTVNKSLIKQKLEHTEFNNVS